MGHGVGAVGRARLWCELQSFIFIGCLGFLGLLGFPVWGVGAVGRCWVSAFGVLGRLGVPDLAPPPVSSLPLASRLLPLPQLKQIM